MPLTTTDAAILSLERAHWKHAGTKEDAMLELGLSPTRYYQRLSALIDTEEAMAADPLLVKRLRRLRDSRRRARRAV